MQKDLLAPQYAQEFMCTGPKCPDNCCQETWTIEIDPATYQLYTVHPELSRLMQPYLKVNHDLASKDRAPATLKQTSKKGGCDLQEANGLCKVHKRFGINALSGTCALYPRSFHSLGADQLLIMTESCPEVARMLVENPDALELDLKPMEVWDRLIFKNQTEFSHDYKRRFELLQGLITLLRYRDVSLEMRLFITTLLIQRAEKLLEEGDASEMSMNDLLGMFSDLVNQGYFEKQVLLLREQPLGGLPLVILEAVLGMSFKKNSSLIDELTKTLKGLQIHSAKDIDESALERLDQARQDYLTPLEEERPWLLENVMVNWVLHTLFPMKKQRITDGWLDMIIRYLLLRSLLSGVGQAQQSLTAKDAARIVYRFGRNISSSDKLQKLQLDLVGRNLNQPAALVHALSL